MKEATKIGLVGIILAVIFGSIFSHVFPHVPLSAGLGTLFLVLGVAVAAGALLAFRAIRGKDGQRGKGGADTKDGSKRPDAQKTVNGQPQAQDAAKQEQANHGGQVQEPAAATEAEEKRSNFLAQEQPGNRSDTG